MVKLSVKKRKEAKYLRTNTENKKKWFVSNATITFRNKVSERKAKLCYLRLWWDFMERVEAGRL